MDLSKMLHRSARNKPHATTARSKGKKGLLVEGVLTRMALNLLAYSYRLAVGTEGSVELGTRHQVA